MRTYIVTGGAGFIGSGIAKRLADKGDNVYILDDLSTGFERNIPESAIFYKVDIADSEALRRLDIPDKVDTVFHLAAQASGEASFDDPARDIDVNYKGTYNILRLGKSKGAERFIYTSSMSVYGAPAGDHRVSEDSPCRPVSYYGCNKLASERFIGIFAEKNGVIPTIFRLFNVYGPGQNMLNMKQGMVSIYMSYLLNGEPIHVKGALDRVRDFVFIDDVLGALIASETSEKTYNEIFNVGTGAGTTVKELVTALIRAHNKDRFDDWVRVEGGTPGDIKGCIADIRKLTKALGWEPKYRLEEGVKEMKKWTGDTINWWAGQNA